MSPKKPENEVIVGEGGPTSAGWHQISTFLECAKRFQFKVVRGIKMPLTTIPDYFAVGSLFHAGRARWFARKFDTSNETWKSIQAAIAEEAEKQPLPIRQEAERLALRYMQEYVNHWCVRPRPTPVATEYLLGPAPIKPDDPFFLHRTARLDDVSKYPEGGGELYIGEAKTDGDSLDNCVETYNLHGQPLLQLLLWKMAPQGEAKLGPIKGVMLDVLVKGRKGQKSKFARMPIPITDHSLQWYVKSMRGYLRAAASVDWNADVPRNITQCKRCDFRDLCKYGKSAAGRYVTAGGNSLVRWRPDGERQVPPWE